VRDELFRNAIATPVGRWADDQFLVILNDRSGDSLRAVGNRINRMLASDGMEWRGERRSVLERARRNMQTLSIQDLQCDDLQLKDLRFKDL
jgi:hypothetical protein